MPPDRTGAEAGPNFPAVVLDAVRPPFPPRGQAWPAFDPEELATFNDAIGGNIVHGDLSRYVAQRCIEPFLKPPTTRRPEAADPLFAVPEEILRAVATGAIKVPDKAKKRCRAWLEKTTALVRPPVALDQAELAQTCRNLDAEWARAEGRTPDPADDDTLVLRVLRRLSKANQDRRHKKQRRSTELSELLEYVRQVAKLPDPPTPSAVRDAMVAAVVRGMGWSQERFCRHEWNAPPAVVDDAIARFRRVGPTHGHRHPTATFREKYAWIAVNVVAGELADRLPIWEEDSRTWVRLNDLSGIGNGMPDPLPMSIWKKESPKSIWHADVLWPLLFADVTDLAARAERWLVDAPLPDPTDILRASIDPWPDAAILALKTYRRGHMSCLDQSVWVASFVVPQNMAALWKRDARYLYSPHNHLHEERMSMGTALHVSPAMAVWAPWLDECNSWDKYRTLDSNGRAVTVKRTSLVAQVTCEEEDDGEVRRTPEVWLPSSLLGKQLGIVSVQGNQHGWSYLSREGATVAVEIDERRGETWVYNHQYLAVDRSELLKFCRQEKFTPVWAIRLWREATPALWFKGDGKNFRPPPTLLHRERDVYWLVFGDPSTGELSSMLLGDTLELFPRRKKHGSAARDASGHR